MDNIQFPELTTERLLLRRLKRSDWPVVSYLRSDATVNQFVKRSNAPSKELAIEFIERANDSIDKHDLFQWCIVERNNDQMIGSICLWNFSEDRQTAEVGYDLSPAWHSKGIMTEALTHVLEFGFNNLGLEKIEAYTQWNNERSRRLLERNGFSLIEDKIDDQNRDNLVYEIKASS